MTKITKSKHLKSGTQSCFVCESTDVLYLYRSKGYRIGACKNCGLTQVMDSPTDEFLNYLYKDLHVKHLKYRNNKAAQKENQSRVKLIKRYIKQGASVLDAGCASGDFVRALGQDFNPYGIDISADAIRHVQNQNQQISHQFTAGDLSQLGNDWPQFDAVCLWDVIEHLKNPVRVLKQIVDKTKPGGYIFMSTPNYHSLMAKMLKANWHFMIPPYHLTYFGPKDVKNMVSSFDEVSIQNIESRGKWTNISFIFYKLSQILPRFFTDNLVEKLGNAPLGNINIYAPTNDVMYIVMKKQLA